MNYLDLLSVCPVVKGNNYIGEWLDSVSTIDGAVGTAQTPDNEPPQDDEPPRKRRRTSSSKPLDCPYYLPDTPSLTNSHRELLMPEGTPSSSRGRKRPGNDSADSAVPELNNQLAHQMSLDLGKGVLPSPQSSSKKRNTSPMKHRADLLKLAKPCRIQELEELDSLPSDVSSLYQKIKRTAEYQQNIVPKELRDALIEEKIPYYAFYEEASTQDGAEAMLSIVRDIRYQAVESTEMQRHEMGWNHSVHTPLLLFAFNTKDRPSQSGTQFTVRMEGTMTASIARDSVPILDKRFSGAISNRMTPLAWSVPESVTEQSSVSVLRGPARGETKKVDYVLVLKIAEGTPFYKIIDDLIMNDVGSQHINQSNYTPLSRAPIAVSIETKVKSSPRDALVQLGIWVASWHKRMYDLRSYKMLTEGIATDISKIEHPPLVSVPLIITVSHDWEMYFACDAGHSIIIRGPVPLGSTSTILRTFALLASLKIVKEWILDTFRKDLEAWLSPKAPNVGATENNEGMDTKCTS
ncbi:hypothetical protein F4803DRAFT_515102 [Xylaria telfairii]|nr:hypothetical protein F4803DRAFT_515102 [Xylaria telfairii]